MREGDPLHATVAPPAPIIDPGAIASRLTSAEGELAKVRHGLGVEEAAMTSALAAAQGSARESDAWGTAQLQLTRLEVIAGQLADLEPGVAQLTRDAEGADAATLARARALAANVESSRATLSRVTQAARDALAR